MSFVPVELLRVGIRLDGSTRPVGRLARVDRRILFEFDASATWRLAPAYDLTFSGGPGGEHWMTVAGEGRAPGAPVAARRAAASRKPGAPP